MNHPIRVLFLCAGNSARSQMAEGLLRSIGGGDLEVHGAGTDPKGLHPLAVEVMQQADSEMTQSDDRYLRPSWDGDRDGKPDADTSREFKRGRRDCLIAAPTAVPLPGTLLFFGSGLLGLAATLRTGKRVRSSGDSDA